MNTETSSAPEQIDPAAIFACASSLWQSCDKTSGGVNLSDHYGGMDELMRVCMRIANRFEAWSCHHIDFDEVDTVWPYLLEDKFGDACLDAMLPTGLESFDDSDCLRVAMRLHLPIIRDGKLPLPYDVVMDNPTPNSPFRKFRIQTVRDENEEDGFTEPYTMDDEPFDENFGEPYFGIYGVY
ncbi:MAG TPA: hypothetical protein VMH87_00985, partial [Pseudomonadales bacterium]|nr:hypothetical protein [Pseudomonadales bacterium]